MPRISSSRGYRQPLDLRFDQPASTVCPDISTVGAVLRRRRKELGWTVELAAEVCQVNPRTISELERGVRQIGFGTVATYAQNMGVDIVLQIRGK